MRHFSCPVRSTTRCRAVIRILLASLFLIAMANATTSRADEADESEARSRFCSQPFTSDSLFRSEASKDLYNAALWMTGTAAIQFGANEKTRWSTSNSFDRNIRDGLRADSKSTREAASTASDVMLGLTAGLLPLASIGKTLWEHECHEAYEWPPTRPRRSP